MRIPKSILTYGVLAAFFLAGSAGAASVVAKTFSSLCNEADIAFIGTVDKVVSQWSDPKQQSIETLVTFTDVQPLYGTGSADVTLRFAGGTVGDLRQEIGGMPHFSPKQRVLIFARNERSVSPVVGFHQGLIRIVDARNGPVVMTADWHPILAVKDDAIVSGPNEGDASVAMSLDDFLNLVRPCLGQRRGAGS